MMVDRETETRLQRTQRNLVARVIQASLVEGILGILTGFVYLLLLAVGARSHVTISEIVLITAIGSLVIVPILLRLHMHLLRGWVEEPQLWALFNTGSVLVGWTIVGILSLTLRQRLGPNTPIISLVVTVAVTVGTGVWAAFLQRRYLSAGHDAEVWLRNALLAWGLAGGVHALVELVTSDPFNICLGVAAGYMVYGLIAHATLAWFSWQHIVQEARQMWRSPTGSNIPRGGAW